MRYSSAFGNAAGAVVTVNRFGLRTRRISEIQGTEVSGFKFNRYTAMLLIVGHGAAHKFFIAGEVRGKSLDTFLFFPARQHFFLQRNVHAHIRSAGSLLAVVKRIEKGIAEENPVESLGVQVGSHHGAIRQANLYVQFVEDAVEIRGAAGLFRRVLFVGQPFGMLGLEIIVRVAEKRFSGGDKLRIVVAQAKGRTLVGRRGHGVDIGIVGEAGMGVIVVHGDLVDLEEQAVVRFLDVTGGIGRGLRVRRLRPTCHNKKSHACAQQMFPHRQSPVRSGVKNQKLRVLRTARQPTAPPWRANATTRGECAPTLLRADAWR